MFFACFRNLWSLYACSCNREPTQAIQWFTTYILVDLYSFECPVNKGSRGCWLDNGKFSQYPFYFTVIYFMSFHNLHLFFPYGKPCGYSNITAITYKLLIKWRLKENYVVVSEKELTSENNKRHSSSKR